VICPACVRRRSSQSQLGHGVAPASDRPLRSDVLREAGAAVDRRRPQARVRHLGVQASWRDDEGMKSLSHPWQRTYGDLRCVRHGGCATAPNVGELESLKILAGGGGDTRRVAGRYEVRRRESQSGALPRASRHGKVRAPVCVRRKLFRSPFWTTANCSVRAWWIHHAPSVDTRSSSPVAA